MFSHRHCSRIPLAQASGAQSPGKRRGAVIAEGAIVLSVMIVVLFTMFDLGLAVLMQNSLSEATRRLARAASVRGSKAPAALGTWGTVTINSHAGDGSAASAALIPALVAMEREKVNFKLQWLDADNGYGNRVQVTVTYQFKPMVPLFLGSSAINLTSSSTIRISH